jgi:hypothetical protein
VTGQNLPRFKKTRESDFSSTLSRKPNSEANVPRPDSIVAVDSFFGTATRQVTLLREAYQRGLARRLHHHWIRYKRARSKTPTKSVVAATAAMTLKTTHKAFMSYFAALFSATGSRSTD